MNKRIIKIVTVIISILFGVFGFAAVIKPEYSFLKFLNITAEDAIKWFGLSFIAFIFPYLKEISISGYGFKVWDELQKTREKIDNLEFIIKSQKKESREYLIKSFSEYINSLSEDEKYKKIIELNKIYFKELNIKQSEVKKALNNWLDKEKIKECKRIIDLTETVTIELIDVLKVFQEKNGYPYPDGIFGYYTCEKVKEYMD